MAAEMSLSDRAQIFARILTSSRAYWTIFNHYRYLLDQQRGRQQRLNSGKLENLEDFTTLLGAHPDLGRLKDALEEARKELANAKAVAVKLKLLPNLPNRLYGHIKAAGGAATVIALRQKEPDVASTNLQLCLRQYNFGRSGKLYTLPPTERPVIKKLPGGKS